MPLCDYQVIRSLGQGTFGQVFLVYDRARRQESVLKKVPLAGLSQQEQEDALNESRVMSRLDHFNIVSHFESFIEDGVLNIIMEHCQGGDLYELIRKRKGSPIEEEALWSMFIQLCQGLKQLHDKRILHRDIKAQNIFLDGRGNIKIGDLGLGKIMGPHAQFAVTYIGTPLYFSPELCEEKPYDDKSDIWALGCLMYELATFNPPFIAQNQIALAKKIVHERPAPIPQFYSEEFRSLVSLLLRKDPSGRPSVDQILDHPAIIIRIERAMMKRKERRFQDAHVGVEHKLQKEVEDLKEKYRSMRDRYENQLQAAKSSSKLLSSDLRRAEDENACLRREVASLKEKLDDDHADSERELAAARRTISALQHENKKLKIEVETVYQRDRQASNHLDRAWDQLRAAEERVKGDRMTLSEDIRLQEEANARAKADLDRQNAEIDAKRAIVQEEAETLVVRLEECQAIEEKLRLETERRRRLNAVRADIPPSPIALTGDEYNDYSSGADDSDTGGECDSLCESDEGDEMNGECHPAVAGAMPVEAVPIEASPSQVEAKEAWTERDKIVGVNVTDSSPEHESGSFQICQPVIDGDMSSVSAGGGLEISDETPPRTPESKPADDMPHVTIPQPSPKPLQQRIIKSQQSPETPIGKVQVYASPVRGGLARTPNRVSPSPGRRGRSLIRNSPSNSPSYGTHTPTRSRGGPEVSLPPGLIHSDVNSVGSALFAWHRTGVYERTPRKYNAGQVWEGKQKHTLISGSSSFGIFAQVNPHATIVGGSPGEAAQVSLKSLRVRGRGQHVFERLRVQGMRGTLDGATVMRDGVRDILWVPVTTELTKGLDIVEFIIEFNAPNAIDEIIVLKHDAALFRHITNACMSQNKGSPGEVRNTTSPGEIVSRAQNTPSPVVDRMARLLIDKVQKYEAGKYAKSPFGAQRTPDRSPAPTKTPRRFAAKRIDFN